MNMLSLEMPEKIARIGISIFMRWSSEEDIEPTMVQIYFPGNQEKPEIENVLDPLTVIRAAPDHPGRQPGITMSALMEGVPLVANGAFEVWISNGAGRRRIGFLHVRHTPQVLAVPAPPSDSAGPDSRPKRRRARSNR
jgi:hypothetical protein